MNEYYKENSVTMSKKGISTKADISIKIVGSCNKHL